MNTSAARSCSLVIALVVHVYGSPVASYHVSTDSREGICQPTQCVQNHQQLTCDDCIPLIVPDTVNEIVLNSLHGYHLVAHGFCKVSWTNVRILTISNGLKDESAISIVDYAFDCLPEIETLRLNVRKLSNLTANSFYGLLNIRGLDLTDCSRLETPALSKALSLATVVPKLKKIILSNVGSVFGGIHLSQDFIDVLARRNITELNLSSSYIYFEDIPFKGLCDTLHTLNMSKSHVLRSSVPIVVCAALRVLDVSGIQVPKSKFLPTNVTTNDTWLFDDLWYEFFGRVSVLYLNDLISRDHYFIS